MNPDSRIASGSGGARSAFAGILGLFLKEQSVLVGAIPPRTERSGSSAYSPHPIPTTIHPNARIAAQDSSPKTIRAGVRNCRDGRYLFGFKSATGLDLSG
jgi:hypothetical protein